MKPRVCASGQRRRQGTPPPERGGLGERAPVAQLIAPAQDPATGDRHLVAAFVLPGGTRPDRVVPRRLDAGRAYRVTDLATGASHIATGAELAAGIPLEGPDRVTSWLIELDPVVA